MKNYTKEQIDSFMHGYLMAIATKVMVSDEIYIKDNEFMYNSIQTNLGNIGFVINRGICPIGGNIPYAYIFPEDSTVDIYLGWEDNSNLLKHLTVIKPENTHNDYRLSIEEFKSLLYEIQIL